MRMKAGSSSDSVPEPIQIGVLNPSLPFVDAVNLYSRPDGRHAIQ